jgi:tetratricopeptide (TPR) repeat protein
MLSAFVDGQLEEPDRSRVADHVSRCEDCYTVVRETTLALTEMGAREVARSPGARPFAVRWALPLAATLAIAVAGGIVGRNQGLFLPAADRAKLPLVKAVGPHQFFEARLSGGFAHGPLVGEKRGPSDESRWAVTGAAGAAVARAGKDPTPANRAAAAAAWLLQGDSSQAVRILEELNAQQPSADVANDLAAAYLVRARSEDSAADWSEALEASDHALELEPGMAEALYNKGLALEGLSQRGPAIENWKAFLQAHPNDAWLADVRARLARLTDAR